VLGGGLREKISSGLAWALVRDAAARVLLMLTSGIRIRPFRPPQ
jgi:hypothetical protein